MGQPMRLPLSWYLYDPLLNEKPDGDDTQEMPAVTVDPTDTGEYPAVTDNERETQTATAAMHRIVIIDEPAIDTEDTPAIPLEVITQEARKADFWSWGSDGEGSTNWEPGEYPDVDES